MCSLERGVDQRLVLGVATTQVKPEEEEREFGGQAVECWGEEMSKGVTGMDHSDREAKKGVIQKNRERVFKRNRSTCCQKPREIIQRMEITYFFIIIYSLHLQPRGQW